MPDNLNEKLIEKIQATNAAYLETKQRMITHHLSDPEAYERAFHDLIEAEAARRAYADAYLMATGSKYVSEQWIAEIDS